MTQAQLASDAVFFTDTIPDVLRGVYLYTNENSGEGESQANNQPPLCQDMTYFKSFAFYANCSTPQMLNVAVINPLVMSATDYIEINLNSVTRKYVAETGVANQTVLGTVANNSGALRITYPVHALANGWTVFISNATNSCDRDWETYFLVTLLRLISM